jgi:hypothetical protein
MNADFEAELSYMALGTERVGTYRRLPFYDALNRRLAPHLLWLARRGDALLIEEAWREEMKSEAARRGVELISTQHARDLSDYLFTPWGWTPKALSVGQESGAKVSHQIPFNTVMRVNSKLWSHALEIELGWALSGAMTASTIEELQEGIRRACPEANDKWVIKSPFGFAARDRVLGRGPSLEEAQGRWVERQLQRGEQLIFQPWLDVVREYGVVMEISPAGDCIVHGISDLQTNGAGTGRGYLLGRSPSAQRAVELKEIAQTIGARLFKEGYYGPVGIDALEHAGGLHPLLEINARYTMGFVAVAVERSLNPQTPVFWATK